MQNNLRIIGVAVIATALVLAFELAALPSVAEDWPMLGRDGTRNSVSAETGSPLEWSPAWYSKGRMTRGPQGIRWSGTLGSTTHSTPVVSAGLVWIGTNSIVAESPRGYHSVLKCFRVADGKQVYEFVSPTLPNRIQDAGWTGLGSSPLIEGDRLWLATNRAEVLCLDIGPLIRGDGQPRELWKRDLLSEFDVFLHAPLMGPPRPCSIGPSWNERIYVTIANGVANDHVHVPKPNAPSLVCLNKHTGAVQWTDNSPGANILVTQAASPTVAEIGGQVQVIVPQSDGWMRAFDPETGKVLWEFDVNLKSTVYSNDGRRTRNGLYANAVVYDGRVYVASGLDAEQGEGQGRLVCVDPTKRGDVSSELAINAAGQTLPRRRVRAFDPAAGEKAIPNPNSALVWEFVTRGKKFEEAMHRTISSVTISRDLVIAADFAGLVHCLDAKTGKRFWVHDTLGAIWTTPLIVGDKVYVADEDAEVTVFQLSADPMHSEPLATIAHQGSIYGSPIYANGTLYVPTKDKLLAVDAAAARRAYEHRAHWPQWRGAQRDNRSRDTGLQSSWPAEGPPLVWRVDGLGDGIASLAISGFRIFTTTTYGNVEYAVALDESTGERLWATPIGSAVKESPLMRWLSQRTPTVDGNRVYVYSNLGSLVCLDATTGSVNWRLSYPEMFGTARGKWGFCDRPLVDDNKLICTPGGSKATVAALDKFTGAIIWTKVLEPVERAGYASPLIVETEGLRQYVVVLDKGIAAFDADDGHFLWRYDGTHNQLANSYTPLILPDGLLCPNGRDSGIARLKLRREGDKVVADEVYLTKLNLDAFEDSTALVDGHLYTFGIGGIPICFDANNGKQVWASRGSGGGKGAATFADGHLYARWSNGTVALVEANPQMYVEKSHFQLPDPRTSSGVTFPVVAGGRLYVRDNDRLFCYDVVKHATEVVASTPNVVQWTAPVDVGVPLRPNGARVPNAIFVPTPNDVVHKMLAEAKVGKEDVLYDLGSGDGRIVIAAAKQYQCRAVGIELDPELVALSRQRAKEAQVEHLVTIREADLFSADFSDATVVTVYLYPELLHRLYPKLIKLSPTSRIVSHQFEIPNYPAEKTLTIDSQETGAKHAIHLWSSRANVREVRRFGTERQGVIKLAVARDGSFAASVGTDGTVRVWELETGRELHRLMAHRGQSYAVALSPDGRQMATGGEDKQVLLWDVASGKQIRKFSGHENNVCGLAFSPDGRQLASGSWDQTIRIWDIATGKEMIKLQGHTAGIMGVAFSPDGAYLASAGGEDLTVRLWEASTGKVLQTFQGHTAMVRAVEFSPDGRRILSGAYKGDGSARLWDVATGKQLLRFGSIPEGVHGVAFDVTGARAILAGADRAELWDLHAEKVIQIFVNLATATDAVFLPDSAHALLASTRDKTLRLWRLPEFSADPKE